MCNLYRMTKGTAEVAALFAVEADLSANYAQEVYPGYPGLGEAARRSGRCSLEPPTAEWFSRC